MSAVGMHLMEAACGWEGRAGGQYQQWGRAAAMGHRACSGDRAGTGQESSYRSFVSCRSGKLRFHRGSKRERDINTRLSARPAEMQGAARRDLVPSISPCCHGAGTCWGSAWVGHASLECLAPCAGLWVQAWGQDWAFACLRTPQGAPHALPSPMAGARCPQGVETSLVPQTSPLHLHFLPMFTT